MPASTQLETPSTSPLTPDVIRQLRGVTILASLSDERLSCLEGGKLIHLDRDELLLHQGEVVHVYSMLLEGSLRLTMKNTDGVEQTFYMAEAGWAFGEVPLLANIPSAVDVTALEPCTVFQLDEDQFWNLMTLCPEVRKAILGNMAMRIAKMQSATFQQEKMAALGTMAAGLMHELNNPGSAARRGASQLRDNLRRLHELGQRFTGVSLSQDQKECLLELQDYALNSRPANPLTSIEQSDAEEALSEWLESAKIENAWKLAPTLVGVGLRQEDLECARGEFDRNVFSDALNWLEALVSSQQLVGTIEESISRITDLVTAVKSYAYEGKGLKHSIDVNQSIHATFVILAHKLREKQITLEKTFGANLPPLSSNCQGVNQIWTNLLDNAIDAVPQNGRITLRTWAETTELTPGSSKPRTHVCVLIADNGAGIPLECQAQVFDPFFTTKPVGVGTGLGLGIVYRIVEQCGGTVHFTSMPGSTEFVVRLPAEDKVVAAA